MRNYPDLGSASDWLCRVGNFLQPIKSTIQIWVATCHQYGISALISQTTFCWENQWWRSKILAVFSCHPDVCNPQVQGTITYHTICILSQSLECQYRVIWLDNNITEVFLQNIMIHVLCLTRPQPVLIPCNNWTQLLCSLE